MTDKSAPIGIWNNDPEEVNKKASHLRENKGEVGQQYIKFRKPHLGLRDPIFAGIFAVILVVLISAIPLMSTDYSQVDAAADIKLPAYLILLTSFGMYFAWIGHMYLTSYRKGSKSVAKDYLIKFKKQDILWGILFAAVGFGFVTLTSIILEQTGLNLEGSDNGSFIMEHTGIWFILIGIVMASIVGPLAEEFFFRGYLMNSITHSITYYRDKSASESSNGFGVKIMSGLYRARWVIAVILSSVVFGFMHFQGTETFGQWLVVIITGCLGLMFALMTVFFKRIGPAVFAHMFYNGTTVLIAYIAAQ